MLPKKAIIEFIEIFAKEFGTNITTDEAVPKALAVFDTFKAFIKNNETIKFDLSNFNSND